MKKLFQKLLGKAPASEQESEPDKVPDVSVKSKDPIWVIILKILSYIITLILGFVTSSCTSHLF